MTARRGDPLPVPAPVVGVIDIGTNAVKLVVGSIRDGRVVALHFSRRPTRLGEGLAASGRVPAGATRRTAVAVKQLAAEARAHGAGDVVAIGTYALRTARNGREAARSIARHAGVPVRVLPARKEGELVLAAVRSRLARRARRDLLVVDIGGGSAQLVLARDGRALAARSVPLGAVLLTERYLLHDPVDPVEHARMARRIESVVSRLFDALPRRRLATADLVVAGGAATTALRMLGMPAGRSLPAVSRAALERLDARCRRATIAQRRRFPGMTPDRADIMPAGLAVLVAFARHARARSLRVFEGGWREGVILDRAQRAPRSRRRSGPTARPRAAARKGR